MSRPGPPWAPQGAQVGTSPLPDLAGGVDVPQPQQVAEVRVIRGGVEVPGQHPRGFGARIRGRRQDRQLLPPPGRVPPRPGWLRRVRVDADQVGVLAAGKLQSRRGLGDRYRPDRQAVAERVPGVDPGATRAGALDVDDLVREQVGEPGLLQRNHRRLGEFLQEQHVGAGAPDQAYDRLLIGVPVHQVRGDDAQQRAAGHRLWPVEGPRQHDGGQRGPSDHGGGRRALAAQHQRAEQRGRGRVRGERQQWRHWSLDAAVAVGVGQARPCPAQNTGSSQP